jgi:hypothetical protein
MYKRNRSKSYQIHCYLKCFVSRIAKFLGLYFIIIFCFYWNVNSRLLQLTESRTSILKLSDLKKKINQNAYNRLRIITIPGGSPRVRRTQNIQTECRYKLIKTNTRNSTIIILIIIIKKCQQITLFKDIYFLKIQHLFVFVCLAGQYQYVERNIPLWHFSCCSS